MTGQAPPPSDPTSHLLAQALATLTMASSSSKGSSLASQGSGACAIIQAAAASLGCSVCFANPGTTEMHFLPALDACPSMRAVLCLHENVATGAADGYARMSRAPAAVLLHLGPGLANGLANLHNARRAGSPMLVIVGDMATVSAFPGRTG